MGPESFENNIQKKFENQTTKAPVGTWANIESSLNAQLVATYASQHSMYKWLSVAAVFIAVLMTGALLYPSNSETQQANNEGVYNALLSSDFDYNSYYSHSNSGISAGDLSFTGIAPLDNVQDDAEDSSGEMIINTRSEVFFVNSRRPSLEAENTTPEIHRYYLVGNFSRSRKAQSDDQKVWAGLEAGAGTFNADFAGSGALASSLNPSGLASAIGSGSFVNPTTSIDQKMSEGVATTLGVGFGMQLSDKWTLESGVAYTSMDNRGSASINVLDVYTIDNNDFINDNTGIEDGSVVGANAREATIEVEKIYDHKVKIRNSVQFASIPLKAGYFVLDRKFSLRVNAGLSANYLVESKLSDPSKQILNGNKLNLYNEWSFDGIGGLELGYSIFNNVDLTLEPNYRHSITPISNSVNSPSRFVVQTGFRYTLN
ncbi:Outer membrane protein beta-barrel domain-containing protein [Ekhidna lutea]|uniref:Outer membrane protein beta-barrel domain-containing protein n=1 Tax=Ekhidna lutea TaxID=447679 RepID=A0A239L6H0_EKHLU|nr:outer membrane beta-barrel protein [Ekhidna lutea]SNT25890.1 Outer membrane protein beta-barrel domain-containing protein [Ekhidna lutea]